MTTRVRAFFVDDFVQAGSIVFVATALTNVLNYVFHFILSRRLGVVDYGTFSSIVAGLSLVAIPASILASVVAKFAAEFHAVDDRARLGTLGRRVGILTLSACVAVVAVGALLSRSISDYLHIGSVTIVLVALLALAANVVTPSFRALIQGMHQFGAYSGSIIIEALGKVVFAIVLVGAGYSVSGAIGALALALGAAGLFAWMSFRKSTGAERSSLHINPSRLIQTVSGVTLSNIALTSMTFVDLVLVKHLFSATDAGFYSAAVICGRVVLFVSGFIPTILLPKAVASAVSGTSPRTLIVRSVIAVVGISGSVLLVYLAFPSTIVSLLAGRSYSAAGPLVFWYALAMALLGALTAAANFRIGTHRFAYVTPLIAVALGEILAISVRHGSLFDVIEILIIGHAVGLLFVLLTPEHVRPSQAQTLARAA